MEQLQRLFFVQNFKPKWIFIFCKKNTLQKLSCSLREKKIYSDHQLKMFWHFLSRSVLYRICYQYFLPQRFQMWLFRILCFNKLFFQTDVLITNIISTTYNWKNQYHSYNGYYPKCILRSCNNFHKGIFSIKLAFIVILEYKLSGLSCKKMRKIEWDKSRMFYQVKLQLTIKFHGFHKSWIYTWVI